jgi:hypothetical protein
LPKLANVIVGLEPTIHAMTAQIQLPPQSR